MGNERTCPPCTELAERRKGDTKSAPAPLPGCRNRIAPIVQCCICSKPVHTCEADNASGPNNHVCPAHPEGAEREGGQWVCSEDCDEVASALELLRDEGFRDDADIVTQFITTQARRLAEVESSVGVVQFRRLQAQLGAKDAECEELRESLKDANECLTIAHMDGYHKGQKSSEAALAATEVKP